MSLHSQVTERFSAGTSGTGVSEPCFTRGCPRGARFYFCCPSCCGPDAHGQPERKNRYTLCRKCAKDWTCPYCSHLAVDTDFTSVSNAPSTFQTDSKASCNQGPFESSERGCTSGRPAAQQSAISQEAFGSRRPRVNIHPAVDSQSVGHVGEGSSGDAHQSQTGSSSNKTQEYENSDDENARHIFRRLKHHLRSAPEPVSSRHLPRFNEACAGALESEAIDEQRLRIVRDTIAALIDDVVEYAIPSDSRGNIVACVATLLEELPWTRTRRFLAGRSCEQKLLLAWNSLMAEAAPNTKHEMLRALAELLGLRFLEVISPSCNCTSDFQAMVKTWASLLTRLSLPLQEATCERLMQIASKTCEFLRACGGSCELTLDCCRGLAAIVQATDAFEAKPIADEFVLAIQQVHQTPPTDGLDTIASQLNLCRACSAILRLHVKAPCNGPHKDMCSAVLTYLYPVDSFAPPCDETSWRLLALTASLPTIHEHIQSSNNSTDALHIVLSEIFLGLRRSLDLFVYHSDRRYCNSHEKGCVVKLFEQLARQRIKIDSSTAASTVDWVRQDLRDDKDVSIEQMHRLRVRLVLVALLFGAESSISPVLTSADEVLLSAALRALGDLTFLQPFPPSTTAALVDKVRSIDIQGQSHFYYAAYVGTLGSLMRGAGAVERVDPRYRHLHDSVRDICDTIEWFRRGRRLRPPRILYEGLWALNEIFVNCASVSCCSHRIHALASEAREDLFSRGPNLDTWGEFALDEAQKLLSREQFLSTPEVPLDLILMRRLLPSLCMGALFFFPVISLNRAHQSFFPWLLLCMSRYFRRSSN